VIMLVGSIQPNREGKDKKIQEERDNQREEK
jgi:hypothetical protein